MHYGLSENSEFSVFTSVAALHFELSWWEVWNLEFLVRRSHPSIERFHMTSRPPNWCPKQ